MTAEPIDSGLDEISVLVEAPAWDAAIPALDAHIRRVLGGALLHVCPEILPSRPGIGVLLADDARVQALNAEWRGQDKPTNVLAFPSEARDPDRPPGAPVDGQPLELGDIVVAFETCAAEAAAQAIPFVEHVDHLTVHGLLHLLGYDHVSEADATRMERLEAEILAGFGIPDPYRAERDV